MFRLVSTALVALLCCLTLTACGGTEVVSPYDPPPRPPKKVDPPDDDDPPPEANVYETVYSEAGTTSNLSGVGLGIPTSGQEANQIPLLTVSGSVRHDVGPLSLDDGQYAFTGTMYYVDPDDPDQGVYFSDGSGGVYFLSAFDGATFDYVLRYTGEYKIGAETYSSEGVAGIVTALSDVPTHGTATYEGVAFGGGATVSGGSFDLLSGEAAASVNFTAGTLSLAADGFADTGAPVDAVQVSGGTIDGASFSGGTVLLLSDGASADDILGANVQSQFGGSFYGYDDTKNIPDELGGMLLKAGDDGYVALYFAAD